VIFVASLLAYGFQLYASIKFTIYPHDANLVGDLAFVTIGTFGVALSRAWQLLQTAAAAGAGEGQAADTSVVAGSKP
jgi:hypothetical protein